MFNIVSYLALFTLTFFPFSCFATVYEFDQEGEVTVYEAKDYMVLPRHRQNEQSSVDTITLAHAEKDNRPFSDYIRAASRKYKVDSDLIHAIIKAESSYNPYAISPKGAQGLMQLMPGTAKRYGVTDSFSPEENIYGGTKYLRFLLDKYDGDIILAVAAYNAGEGSVDKYRDVPPYSETRAYVQKVSLFIERGE